MAGMAGRALREVGGVARAGAWQHGAVPESDATTETLDSLVGEWLDFADAAALLQIPESRVRVLVKEHQLAAARPRAGAPFAVPASFLQDGAPVKGLPGTLTVLHDAGFDDREAIAWLHRDLDLPGRPIDALRENRGTEVRRRAQALGF